MADVEETSNQEQLCEKMMTIRCASNVFLPLASVLERDNSQKQLFSQFHSAVDC